MRFHSLYRRSFNLSSNCSIVTPSAPAAPPFLFTFSHASHTSRLGMSYDLPCNFGSLMRLHPFRLITFVHQDDPAPSLPNPLRYAGGSQLLRASPPARPASVLCSSRIPPLGVLPLALPTVTGAGRAVSGRAFTRSTREPGPGSCCLYAGCLLYTSDAADEEDSVDLGGRRIIKKK